MSSASRKAEMSMGGGLGQTMDVGVSRPSLELVTLSYYGETLGHGSIRPVGPAYAPRERLVFVLSGPEPSVVGSGVLLVRLPAGSLQPAELTPEALQAAQVAECFRELLCYFDASECTGAMVIRSTVTIGRSSSERVIVLGDRGPKIHIWKLYI
ncbi:jg27023 [Pararge aegeria aegeria]|uniref:Jg27023 protein n=1 Tax=Pararge aegeria aegeria TaxID=348720 RepID=A0A8S4SPK2_9NEOP|nr:jg27023 [Pararge aegeria aegeria]